jgi:hypothetical protein
MSGKNRVAGMENRDRISAGIKHTSRRRVAQSLLATVQNTMLGVFMELWSESSHDRVKEEPRALLLSISLWRVPHRGVFVLRKCCRRPLPNDGRTLM